MASLPPHILRSLVLSQTHEPAVAQVGVLRPFHELELPNEHRLQPPAFRHLRRCEARAPPPGLLFGQVREWAFLHFKRLYLSEQLGP